VTKEVAARRDEVQLETAWPTLTRLIHDFLGIRFDAPMSELELGYWKASVTTQAMPGAREALERFHRAGVPMAVVSNTSFGEPVTFPAEEGASRERHQEVADEIFARVRELYAELDREGRKGVVKRDRLQRRAARRAATT